MLHLLLQFRLKKFFQKTEKKYLPKQNFFDILSNVFESKNSGILAGVAQLAEQLICNQQVAGSSPITGFYGGIAQLGEHLPCKQGVNGSIPFISTSPKG